MIVYNITMKVSPEIEPEWVRWQQQEHIPEIMATGYFHAYHFYRLLDQDTEEGNTYVVQYFSNSRDQFDAYIETAAPLLRAKAFDKWGDQFISFRTIMETVN